MVQSGFIQVQVVVHPLLCVTKDIRPFVYALVLGGRLMGAQIGAPYGPGPGGHLPQLGREK